MDRAHERLLSAPHVAGFFDPNQMRNQFISEYALHRSLLLHRDRTRDPRRASFFFVPFYSRLAYADGSATDAVRRAQANLTASLASCLRASPAWRRSGGRDHLVAISSTRSPAKLFGAAWPLLRSAVLLPIEAHDRRYRSMLQLHALLVIPYYVPHFREDDEVGRGSKRHPVCCPNPVAKPSRFCPLLRAPVVGSSPRWAKTRRRELPSSRQRTSAGRPIPNWKSTARRSAAARTSISLLLLGQHVAPVRCTVERRHRFDSQQRGLRPRCHHWSTCRRYKLASVVAFQPVLHPLLRSLLRRQHVALDG
jgi:hypothetical protein